MPTAPARRRKRRATTCSRPPGGDGEAPLINVIGGKLTTYRRLAEATLEKVEALIGAKGAAWTASAKLPGGDFPADRLCRRR